MEPATSIIRLFGASARGCAPVVARHLGVDRATPHRWMRPVDKNGTGGVIPHRHHPALLALAREMGLPLRPEHFLPGQKPNFGRRK